VNIYALLDRSTVIEERHIVPALAVWQYAERSILFLWGGYDLQAKRGATVLEYLEKKGSRATRTEISNLFDLHVTSLGLDAIRGKLSGAGYIKTLSTTEGAGRPTEYWCLMS
jgi:hypothetical protein